MTSTPASIPAASGPAPRRSRAIVAFKATISIALLAWVIARIVGTEGIDEVVRRRDGIEVGPAALALLLPFVAVTAGIARFRILLAAQWIEVPIGWLARTYLVGRFVATFTPSTVGLDLYRVLAVARRTGEKTRAASAIVTEKCLGLAGLALVTFSVLPFGGNAFLDSTSLLIASALAATALLSLLVLVPRHRDSDRLIGVQTASAVREADAGRVGPLSRKLRARTASAGHRGTGQDPCGEVLVPSARSSIRVGSDLLASYPRIAGLIEGLQARELTSRRFLAALALGVASHLATAFVFVAVGLALGTDAPLSGLVLAGNLLVISALVPISIGGVGVRESVAVVILGAFGISTGEAALIAFVGYLAGQPPALLGGLLAVGGAKGDARADRNRVEPRPAPVAQPS